jgi:putative membrane protein
MCLLPLALVMLMKFLFWIVRIALFGLLFLLALRNTGEVTLELFMGTQWRAPLILILLAAFGLGILAGLLALLPSVMRMRLQLSQLRKTQHTPVPAATPVLPEPTPLHFPGPKV